MYKKYSEFDNIKKSYLRYAGDSLAEIAQEDYKGVKKYLKKVKNTESNEKRDVYKSWFIDTRKPKQEKK